MIKAQESVYALLNILTTMETDVLHVLTDKSGTTTTSNANTAHPQHHYIQMDYVLNVLLIQFIIHKLVHVVDHNVLQIKFMILLIKIVFVLQ